MDATPSSGIGWLDAQAAAAAERLAATPEHLLSPTGRALREAVVEGRQLPARRLYVVR